MSDARSPIAFFLMMKALKVCNDPKQAKKRLKWREQSRRKREHRRTQRNDKLLRFKRVLVERLQHQWQKNTPIKTKMSGPELCLRQGYQVGRLYGSAFV
jgi:hypothetical protein